MKQVCIILLCLSLLTGCGRSNSSVDSTESSICTESSVPLVEQIEVHGYRCPETDMFETYALLLTNNSDKTVDIEANIVAKDGNGNLVGAQSGSARAVAPGQTAAIYGSFSDYHSTEKYEHQLVVSENQTQQSVYGAIDLEYNLTGTKVVVSATNGSKYDADDVWVSIIFLDEETPVGFRLLSMTTEDMRLPSGMTWVEEALAAPDITFDSILLGIEGTLEVD